MENAPSASTGTKVSVFQSILRFVVPKDDRFYDMLEKQAGIGQLAIRKLAELATGDLPTVVAAVQDFEHRGDAAVHEIEKALAATFVTPLDREDIHKLSSELDDVLDRANSAARSCLMRGVVKPTMPMIVLIGQLADASACIVEAVSLLRKHDYDRITVLARKVREIESTGDKVYREAVTALYADGSGIDAKQVVAQEKVLEALESALNHAEDLADSLINLAVKHG